MPIEREINLSSIVEVMWERGKGILLFTIAAMVLGALVTLTIHDRYRAVAQVVMNKSKLGEQTMQNPAIPMNTYLELACSQALLQELLKKYSLTEAPYNMQYPEDLLSRITVESVENTSILLFEVELEDAKTAADVANDAANDLIQKSLQIMQNELDYSSSQLKGQVQAIREDVNKNKLIYETTLIENNKELLRLEIETNNSTLALFRQQKANLDATIARYKAQMAEFEVVFSATDYLPLITTKKSVLRDPTALEAVRSAAGNIDIEALGGIMIEQEELHADYLALQREYKKLKVDLQGALAEEAYFTEQIERLENDLLQMYPQMHRKELQEMVEKMEFDRGLEILGGVDKEQGWVGTTVASERQDLNLTTPAVPPVKKSYPQRSLIVVLIGTIAFLMSFLYYLFRDLYGLMKVKIEEKAVEQA